MNDQQQLGYILAKLNDIAADQQSLTKRFDELEKRVNEKFTTAETVFKILKFLGLVTVAILSFKFGDIGRLWIYFFG